MDFMVLKIYYLLPELELSEIGGSFLLSGALAGGAIPESAPFPLLKFDSILFTSSLPGFSSAIFSNWPIASPVLFCLS